MLLAYLWYSGFLTLPFGAGTYREKVGSCSPSPKSLLAYETEWSGQSCPSPAQTFLVPLLSPNLSSEFSSGPSKKRARTVFYCSGYLLISGCLLIKVRDMWAIRMNFFFSIVIFHSLGCHYPHCFNPLTPVAVAVSDTVLMRTEALSAGRTNGQSLLRS